MPPPARRSRRRGAARAKSAAEPGRELRGLVRRDGPDRGDPGHRAGGQDGRALAIAVGGRGKHPLRLRADRARGVRRARPGEPPSRRWWAPPSGKPRRASASTGRARGAGRAGPAPSRTASTSSCSSVAQAIDEGSEGADGRREAAAARGPRRDDRPCPRCWSWTTASASARWCSARWSRRESRCCRPPRERGDGADRARGAGPHRLRRDHAGHGRLPDLRVRARSIRRSATRRCS